MGVFVRKAEEKDIDLILIELKKFSDFFDSKYPVYGSDENYNRDLIFNLLTNHLFLIAEHDNNFAGFICGFVSKHIFNPEITVLSEIFWWVVPEYRLTKVGSLLFKAYEKFGEENCQWIVMTIESISQVKPEYFLDRGYKLKEQSFLREV